MRPLAYAPAWIAASVLLVVGVLVASLAPLSVPANLPTHFDKFEHALAYAGLAVWFTGIVAPSKYRLVALALAALGLAIEFAQAVTPFGRHGDPLDLLANVAGIGAGIALATWATGGWATRLEAWLGRR